MSIEELEEAVSKLPPDKLAEFSAWFDVYRHQKEFDEWDRQIEADAKAGKLDWLAEEVEEDIAAGRTREL
jgi:hypothetical protein